MLKTFLYTGLFLSLTYLKAQETEVIKKTDIYLEPQAVRKLSIGQLYPGTTVTKLKRDRTGKFIKATVEFYIPLETLEEGRISHPVGVDQIADQAKYRLLQATREGKRVRLQLKVTNISRDRELDFSAMALLKIRGAYETKGELNPFEGKHQGLAILKPSQSIVAELVYDFKKEPKHVELICTGKMGGDKVYYSLGF